MPGKIIITDKSRKVKSQIWSYQVTEIEVKEQQRKLKKMSWPRFEAELKQFEKSQPALFAFVNGLPAIRYCESPKTSHNILGMAIWRAYRVKFTDLPEAKDCYIGVELSVALEPYVFSTEWGDQNDMPTIIHKVWSGLGFTMILNALESALNPPHCPDSLAQTFRKRIWIDNNHYLTKATPVTAPPQ